MINYDGKLFKPVYTSPNGEVSGETVFHYKQVGNVVTAVYAGGSIITGHLMGVVRENGTIDIRYHQVNDKGILMTGVCNSVPEPLENGKIRLHESWEWTSGDLSKGTSIVEEV